MIQKSTIDFIHALSVHNNREWFHANKDWYRQARENVLDFTEYLIGEMAKFDESLIGTDPESCLFRIQRDTRFSKNKTPYKTNFGAFIKQDGRKTPGAGYYVHIGADDSFLGGGIYRPEARELKAIREGIAKNSEDFYQILNEPEFVEEFKDLGGETLKTAPRGYPKDHPAIDLLRHKSFLVGVDIDEEQVVSDRFPGRCIRAFMRMKPMNDFINRSIRIYSK